MMTPRRRQIWFVTVSTILLLFGLTYVGFGLRILPVDRAVLVNWESALYGAIMTGWAVTLLMVGQIAFRHRDASLQRALLVGLLIWLAIEAAASVYFGVWFNVGVDVGVALLFALPLVNRRTRRP